MHAYIHRTLCVEWKSDFRTCPWNMLCFSKWRQEIAVGVKQSLCRKCNVNACMYSYVFIIMEHAVLLEMEARNRRRSENNPCAVIGNFFNALIMRGINGNGGKKSPLERETIPVP
jgi:hypothetical protein